MVSRRKYDQLDGRRGCMGGDPEGRPENHKTHPLPRLRYRIQERGISHLVLPKNKLLLRVIIGASTLNKAVLE